LDDDGNVPALEWLREVKKRDKRITAKFHERILELKELGWEMTRPHADTLRDGIHELRVGFGGVSYRLLYAFHEQTIAVLAHGLTKERLVPPEDIDLAVERIQAFAKDPKKHTFVRATLPLRQTPQQEG
jgi:hypothetical protein